MTNSLFLWFVGIEYNCSFVFLLNSWVEQHDTNDLRDKDQQLFEEDNSSPKADLSIIPNNHLISVCLRTGTKGCHGKVLYWNLTRLRQSLKFHQGCYGNEVTCVIQRNVRVQWQNNVMLCVFLSTPTHPNAWKSENIKLSTLSKLLLWAFLSHGHCYHCDVVANTLT